MIIDPKEFETNHVLNCDLCIVGSGAAGATIAHELVHSALKVVLLEAGGTKYDPRRQDGLHGEVEGNSSHSPINMYRRLVLGGATSIWGGRCVPLSPIDLEPRSYVPHSGWPIQWQKLKEHYSRAQKYCQAGDPTFTVREALGPDAPPTIEGFADADVNLDEIERFSPPTNFGTTYLQPLVNSTAVSVLLNSKATRLHEAEGVISSLDCVGTGGRPFQVRARHYVLATGGLETPRLLMNSDDTRRGGIGNESDLLGRYYMCHIENTLGLLKLQPRSRPTVVHFERSDDSENVYVRRKFSVSAAAQERDGLLNTTARLHYPLIADPSHRNGVLSAMYLVKDVILPEYRRKLATIEIANRDRLVRNTRFWSSHVANIGLDSINVARFGVNWLQRRTFAKRKLPFVTLQSYSGIYPLDVNAEQVPDADNRITLINERGVDNLRKIKVSWRMTDQDVDSLVRSMTLMRDAFLRSGCATLDFDSEQLVHQVRASSPVGGHHIGTARMAENRSEGVVDPHCRVHGVANLHLAGSAVFPTCGHANPTLTIVALAVRLADRLKLTMASPG